MVESRRGTGDKVAVSSTVRDERVRMHVIDKFVDEIVVLFKLIGECGGSAYERGTRCKCCQPADQPQQSARYVGAIHLVLWARMGHEARKMRGGRAEFNPDANILSSRGATART